MIGGLFKKMGPFMPTPTPCVQPPPLWGGEEHLRGLLGGEVEFERIERDTLEVSAFERPDDFGDHFKGRYGPTIAARANAEKNGKAEELDRKLTEFCAEMNRGKDEDAFFEMEYLLTVARKRG